MMDLLLKTVGEELPEKAEMLRQTLRRDDAPKSFYPGMWLRRWDEGKPWREPTAEVVRVGRTSVAILSAGSTHSVRWDLDVARESFRKVYETPTPELPDWLKKGAEFSLYQWESLKIRRIRWAYASVETNSGVLMFCTLEGLTRQGRPRRTAWDRLLDDSE